MFCGTFDGIVDNRGRLTIPVGMGGDICGQLLFLKIGKYDCVEICTQFEPLFIKPRFLENEMKKRFPVKGNKSKRMIRIPDALIEKSYSFWFEDKVTKVTLVGKGSHIRLLPRHY